MRSDSAPEKLNTPHIPLRSNLREGIEILQAIGNNVVEEIGSEHCFKVETSSFSVAICAKGDHVASVWYDDPIGRGSAAGKERKIDLYLMRYGSLSNWEPRMVNDSIRYWVNAYDKAAMVYGLHSDVIRFNLYYEEYS
jgi:hypothetical protein